MNWLMATELKFIGRSSLTQKKSGGSELKWD
jgi:hypothetical protein